MEKLKHKWDIDRNIHLFWLVLGIIALLVCGYAFTARIMPKYFDDILFEYAFIALGTLLSAIVFYYITMFFFKKLRTKWEVNHRWELIPIFIVFAITGSASARISGPLLQFIGLNKETVSAWVYWPIRILIVFPIYQMSLLLVAWIFGQFRFFWKFEKKMLSRFGLKL